MAPFSSVTDTDSCSLSENDLQLLYELVSEGSMTPEDASISSQSSAVSTATAHETLLQTSPVGQSMETHNHVRHRPKHQKKESLQRMLYISGLCKHVTKVDLYKQFPGSIKVMLKLSHSVQPIQYDHLEKMSDGAVCR